MSIQISSVRKNDKDQTVFFILIDDEGIARKMGADTPILSGAELQEYLDARGEEYLALALAKEAGGKTQGAEHAEQDGQVEDGRLRGLPGAQPGCADAQ